MKKRNKILLAASPLLVFAAVVIFQSFTIQPLAWNPLPKPEFTGTTSLNERLLDAKKISLEGWYGPEDIVFDNAGNIFCGVHKGETNFRQGSILRIDQHGKAEVFYDAGAWVAGLHFDALGNLVALSHRHGLISISPDKKVTVLANKDQNGQPFFIPNGIDIASDGKIYFSNTSARAPYTIKYGRKIILEMKPQGGLYSFDPSTNKLTTLIDGTYFGNGVVISKDESHLLMVETAKYRVLRYWLQGPRKGMTEIFLDNLPGFPNGISIRQDGTYWLGFSTKRNDALDDLHPNPAMKKLVYALPEFLQPKPEKFGMLMHVSADGAILESYFDTKGKMLPEAGAVKEQNGYLYVGGDVLPYIAKLKLDNIHDHQSTASVK